jgi:hypothetical protein
LGILLKIFFRNLGFSGFLEIFENICGIFGFFFAVVVKLSEIELFEVFLRILQDLNIELAIFFFKLKTQNVIFFLIISISKE